MNLRRVEIGPGLFNPLEEQAGIAAGHGPGGLSGSARNGIDPPSVKSHRDIGEQRDVHRVEGRLDVFQEEDEIEDEEISHFILFQAH
jgi:hypothetical protein